MSGLLDSHAINKCFIVVWRMERDRVTNQQFTEISARIYKAYIQYTCRSDSDITTHNPKYNTSTRYHYGNYCIYVGSEMIQQCFHFQNDQKPKISENSTNYDSQIVHLSALLILLATFPPTFPKTTKCDYLVLPVVEVATCEMQGNQRYAFQSVYCNHVSTPTLSQHPKHQLGRLRL